jgi:hypothetical protein
LAKLENIISLKIAGNHIGNKGAKALSLSVSLTHIDVRNNSIQNKGLEALLTMEKNQNKQIEKELMKRLADRLPKDIIRHCLYPLACRKIEILTDRQQPSNP